MVAKKKTNIDANEGKSSSSPGLAKLRALVDVLDEAGLAELSYEDKDVAVTLRRTSAGTLSAPVAVSAPAPVLAGPVSAVSAAATDEHLHVIKSPFVGTFYRAPSPEAKAFTDLGKSVKKGQTVCIVEAMKLMNEIEADVSGKVVEVLVDNGMPVQYGDELFKIEVS